MKTPEPPFMITGPDVLGEILRRNQIRGEAEKQCLLLDLVLGRARGHIATLGDKEHVESNLPLP